MAAAPKETAKFSCALFVALVAMVCGTQTCAFIASSFSKKGSSFSRYFKSHWNVFGKELDILFIYYPLSLAAWNIQKLKF